MGASDNFRRGAVIERECRGCEHHLPCVDLGCEFLCWHCLNKKYHIGQAGLILRSIQTEVDVLTGPKIESKWRNG